MSEAVDQEVEAIRAVLTALAPLSEKARTSVLEYVARRLGLPTVSSGGLPPPPSREGSQAAQHGGGSPPGADAVHIKQFKEAKGPHSANEMAAVVAYYLANVAPPEDRRGTVNQKTVETYFKIAGFPLPGHVRQTLPNAKNAGYFDLVGDGEYRLNAVGHNLVAHSLPRGSVAKGSAPSARQKPARRKPAAGRRKSSK